MAKHAKKSHSQKKKSAHKAAALHTKKHSKEHHAPVHHPPHALHKMHAPMAKPVEGEQKVKEEYQIVSDNVEATVKIVIVPTEYVPIYDIEYPQLSIATHAVLNQLKEELIMIVPITTKEFIDPNALKNVKAKFLSKALEMMERLMPFSSDKERKVLAGHLVHEMLGLGDLDILLEDPHLEEIVINGSRDPVWVYHKRHGWLKTTIKMKDEEQIYTYSAAVGRRVGRQITNLDPLMDAHLTSGDRVNATLFPISTQGNTMTIRKFSRSPWTIIHFLEANTLSLEVAAILWLAIQYELNILVAGGTASGKTSMLNILMPFMPPNQRIISIEDTREIALPTFLHWVPFSSREANPEGKGEVSMLDLLANALRMRPDRIIIGEIRRQKEAEVMFEAIRTGHSAYASFHGDKADQVYKRLTNPPMSLPEPLISALHLIVVQYRHRRKGLRRTLEVAEIVPGDEKNMLNVLYRWNSRTDQLEKINKMYRLNSELSLYAGMTDEEIAKDIQDKIAVLQWMIKRQIKSVNTVGKVFAEYYKDEKRVIDFAKLNKDPKQLLGEELSKELTPS